MRDPIRAHNNRMKLSFCHILIAILLLASTLAAKADGARSAARHRLLSQIEEQSGGSAAKEYELLYEALREQERKGDRLMQGIIRCRIGSILYDLESPEQAYQQYEKAERLFAGSHKRRPLLTARLGKYNCMYYMGQRAQSLRGLEDMERLPEVGSDTLLHLNILLSLTYQLGENAPQFAHYNQKLISLFRAQPESKSQRFAINIGFYFYHKGQYDQSIHQYRKALSGAEAGHNLQDAAVCLRALAMNYAEIGQTDSCAVYFMRMVQCEEEADSINEIHRVRNQQTLNTIHEYERKVAEERHREQFYATCIGLSLTIVILLLTCLATYLWRKRRLERMRKLLKEAENRELTMSLENERLKTEQKQRLIEQQGRQLTVSELELEEKKNALRQISEQIKEAHRQKEVSGQIASQVSANIKLHLATEDDWKTFYQAFEQVHNGFMTALAQRYPTLTEFDKRLCAFIRIGMDNKQIALMLNIQNDSLYKNRYRLRKKMGLGKEQSLEDTLCQIG